VGADFPDREIEEHFEFFGPWKRERSCVDMDLPTCRLWREWALASVWYKSPKRFFSFCSREEEKNSPCHQGEGTCNQPIQRIGKCREEEAGR
jgi:hypothetical protein